MRSGCDIATPESGDTQKSATRYPRDGNLAYRPLT